MERYTTKGEFGINELVLKNSCENFSGRNQYWDITDKSNGTHIVRGEAIDKFARYEDIGLTPEQMLEIDKLYSEQCRELEAYKNWREYLIDSVENKIKQIKQTQELDDQTLDAICRSVVKAYENVLDMLEPQLEKDGRHEREVGK